MVRIHLTRASWLITGLLVLVVVAGCYQPAGSGFEQPIFANGPTFTVEQSVVELPTQEPASLFPEQTAEVLPSATPEDLPIIVEPTPSPFMPPTVVIAPTNTPIVATTAPTVDNQASIDAINLLLTPGVTQVADAALQATLDPFELTATHIVGQATAQAGIPLTQTAQALTGIIGATATPVGAAPGLFPTNTPAGVQPSQPITPGVDCIHEVQQTDPNLYRIALRYGVTVESIARASGITNINLILVGQRLTIPGCGTTGAVPPPTSAPTTAAVNVLGDGTTTTANVGTGGTGGGRIHVVQQGETLFELSLQYNVPVATIASANGISNINLIYIGQELVIP